MRYGRPGMPASPLDWKVGIEAVYHRNALAILEECIARWDRGPASRKEG